MLSAELERQLASMTVQTTSSPPMTIASQTTLVLSNGTQLDWGYYSQGDYDQNGKANVADLTPLAIHFQVSAEGSVFSPHTIQAVIDGDGNGEINLADVTPIAINFQNTVTGYNIYRSLDDSDYPDDDPTRENGLAEEIFQIPLADATGNPAEERLTFSAETPEQREGDWLWLRPENLGVEGIASNIVGPVAHPGYTIRGRIVSPNSAISDLQSVAVHLLVIGTTVLTDHEGRYEFSGITPGNYTVVPNHTQWHIEPVHNPFTFQILVANAIFPALD